MVISAAAEPRSAGALLSAASLAQKTNPGFSTASFAQQIEAALEQYLGQSGMGSGVQIDIQPQNSQSPGGGQFLVTVKPAAVNTPAPGAAASPKAATSLAPAANPAPAFASPPPVTQPQPGNSALSPSVSPSAPGGVPAGYQSVPFGAGVSIVPTLATEIARQNAMMSVMSPAAILNQDKVSAAGDPMSGQTINGTNLKWDELTQDQQIAYIYAMDYGMPAGQSMQAYLEANYGPKIMANAPSTNPTLFNS